MHNYRRVTYEDRCQIYAFLQAGVPKSLIAKQIGFHRSTIYRDVRRNTVTSHGYEPPRATAQAAKRFRRCKRAYKVTGEVEVKVRAALARDWSPEQIAGRFKREKVAKVSCQTIYRYVKRNEPPESKRLRRWKKRGAGRLLQRRKLLTNRLWIHDRPKVANNRNRIGDWERDGMFGANRKQVLVCTDRKSRLTKLARVNDYRVAGIANLTMQLLNPTGKVITITNDNGPEFKNGPDLHLPVYFCYPQRPQQRGTVENTIGLIRQYIARTTNINAMSSRQFKEIEHKLNLRPRKCLDYKTPYEVFYNKTVALAV